MPDYLKYRCQIPDNGYQYDKINIAFDKTHCFLVGGTSGSRLLAFRADHYMTGNNFGIESKAIAGQALWHSRLDDRAYPFDRIGIQFSGYITDNAPLTAVCELVKQWNDKYEYPKLRLATAGEFMEYEKNYADKLPVYRNAWLGLVVGWLWIHITGNSRGAKGTEFKTS